MNAQEALMYINRQTAKLEDGIEYKTPTEREMVEDEIQVLKMALYSTKREQRLLDTFDREAEKYKAFGDSYRRLKNVRKTLVEEMER